MSVVPVPSLHPRALRPVPDSERGVETVETPADQAPVTTIAVTAPKNGSNRIRV